jgi:cyanophycin synthetase
MAAPGDLLVIFGDEISRCWKQIIYFNRPHNSNPDFEESEFNKMDGVGGDATYGTVETPADAEDDDQSIAVSLEGMKLVRDKRGVRLASEPEESD